MCKTLLSINNSLYCVRDKKQEVRHVAMAKEYSLFPWKLGSDEIRWSARVKEAAVDIDVITS